MSIPPLVSIDAIHVQSVAAAAALGRIEFQPEIVPADEPVERALRLFIPPDIRRGAISFQTGRNHGLRLDGLLIEIGARAATAVEAIAADRPEVAFLGDLQFVQPAQGLQASLEDSLVVRWRAAQNQSMGELGVVIGEFVFKPAPIGLARSFEEVPSAGKSASRGSD